MKLSRNQTQLDETNILDIDSGEIIEHLKPEPDNMEDWSVRDKDQFHKCETFTKEIEDRKLNLIKTDQDRTDIVSSLLKFGEEGFKIWERICDQDPSGMFSKEN